MHSIGSRMKALVRSGSGVKLRSIPSPVLGHDGEVLLKVDLAGLCRTDIYVADGIIGQKEQIVLGHEFVGTVLDAGDRAGGRLYPGMRVTVNPLVSCGDCPECKMGKYMSCQRGDFLGVDCDGCFAQYVKVDIDSCFSLSDSTPDLAAAYAEPVAASLAVFKAGMGKEENGLIIGGNRFSELLLRIMRLKGFGRVESQSLEECRQLPAGSFDYVIETMVSTEILAEMIRLVRPGGRLVLKSRFFEPVSFSPVPAIKKEPIIYFVNYGSFQEALDYLAEGDLDISDLSGGSHALENFSAVFEQAKQTEALKPFFIPEP